MVMDVEGTDGRERGEDQVRRGRTLAHRRWRLITDLLHLLARA